jgi:hypothetical protein
VVWEAAGEVGPTEEAWGGVGGSRDRICGGVGASGFKMRQAVSRSCGLGEQTALCFMCSALVARRKHAVRRHHGVGEQQGACALPLLMMHTLVLLL